MDRRFKNLIIPAAILCVPIGAILYFGDGLVSLDALRARSVLFHALLTVPLLGGGGLLVRAILPRVVWINLVATVCLWLVLEAAAAVSFDQPESSQGNPEPLVQDAYTEDDPQLGYRLVPNNVARHVSTWNDSVEFDVKYEIDQFGRRITPLAPGKERTRFLIFFGGSNTFGEGVGQYETIPYFAGEFAPRYRPYNYGVPGYGPAQMLDFTATRKFASEVDESRGVAVFHFIPAHLWRVVGASNVSTTWGRHFSNYELSEAGVPVRHGDFATGRPVTTLFYELARHSTVLSSFGLVFPLRLDENDFLLTARILVAARDRLQQQLDLDAFYVTFPPVFPGSQAETAHTMMAALESEGITTVDQTGLYVASDPQFRVAANNYHQAATANRILAKSLADFLESSWHLIP